MPVKIEKRCANCKRMLPIAEFPWRAITGVATMLGEKTRGRFCYDCLLANPNIYERDVKAYDDEWEQLTFDWDGTRG